MTKPVAEVDGDRLIANLTALAGIGANSAGGIDRPAYSKAYRQAADWLKDAMSSAGLRVREDSAGNVIGRIGPDGPALVCGSHIDTVPDGGAYDGALGVLAGLECAHALLREKSPLNRAFEVVAFADEEGAYLSLLGSKAMAGVLQPQEIELATGRDGTPLRDALHSYGLDPLRVTQAARPARDFAAYIELHIEQGPVLEREKIDIGVVDAIFGIRSHAMVLSGAPNHSGTTPLHARRDALRAAAEAIADSFSGLSDEQRRDARLTFGDIKVTPGASNVVPGLVQVVREIRAAGTPTIEQIEKVVDERFLSRAVEHDVGFQARLLADDVPIALSPAVAARVEEVCFESGRSSRRIVSGAGHDAQVFAPVCATGMVFVPSRNGVSHRPDEYTTPTQIRIGLEVLYQFCRALLT